MVDDVRGLMTVPLMGVLSMDSLAEVFPAEAHIAEPFD